MLAPRHYLHPRPCFTYILIIKSGSQLVVWISLDSEGFTYSFTILGVKQWGMSASTCHDVVTPTQHQRSVAL